MQLRSDAFRDGQPIPSANAFCPAPGHDGPFNRSPPLEWSDVPAGTKSLALACVDPDAPAEKGPMGAPIPYETPRTDFVHWLLVDLPPGPGGLAEGADSDGRTARGKRDERTAHGVRGRNDYTAYFAADDAMRGTYYGYDGPCPPENDRRVHRYRFTLYALDVDTLGLGGPFTFADLRRALDGHVLAERTLTGTYTLNPDARL